MWVTIKRRIVKRCRSLVPKAITNTSQAHISAVFEQERHRISSTIVGSDMQGCPSRNIAASVHILCFEQRAKTRAVAVSSREKNIAHFTTVPSWPSCAAGIVGLIRLIGLLAVVQGRWWRSVDALGCPISKKSERS